MLREVVKGNLLEDVSFFLNDLSKVLLRDLDVADVDVIFIDFSLESTSTELHRQISTNLHEVVWLAAVVLVVADATRINALHRVHPDIRAT